MHDDTNMAGLSIEWHSPVVKFDHVSDWIQQQSYAAFGSGELLSDVWLELKDTVLSFQWKDQRLRRSSKGLLFMNLPPIHSSWIDTDWNYFSKEASHLIFLCPFIQHSYITPLSVWTHILTLNHSLFATLYRSIVNSSHENVTENSIEKLKNSWKHVYSVLWQQEAKIQPHLFNQVRDHIFQVLSKEKSSVIPAAIPLSSVPTALSFESSAAASANATNPSMNVSNSSVIPTTKPHQVHVFPSPVPTAASASATYAPVNVSNSSVIPVEKTQQDQQQRRIKINSDSHKAARILETLASSSTSSSPFQSAIRNRQVFFHDESDDDDDADDSEQDQKPPPKGPKPSKSVQQIMTPNRFEVIKDISDQAQHFPIHKIDDFLTFLHTPESDQELVKKYLMMKNKPTTLEELQSAKLVSSESGFDSLNTSVIATSSKSLADIETDIVHTRETLVKIKYNWRIGVLGRCKDVLRQLFSHLIKGTSNISEIYQRLQSHEWFIMDAESITDFQKEIHDVIRHLHLIDTELTANKSDKNTAEIDLMKASVDGLKTDANVLLKEFDAPNPILTWFRIPDSNVFEKLIKFFQDYTAEQGESYVNYFINEGFLKANAEDLHQQPQLVTGAVNSILSKTRPFTFAPSTVSTHPDTIQHPYLLNHQNILGKLPESHSLAPESSSRRTLGNFYG